ncbi:MAG: folate/biopterin family MFS transporter [Candidatus Heimdallarchaeota archaeon]|nr:folate/biopterin family MFS transporter [Candidatus Heimdallarchaeota archaeon]
MLEDLEEIRASHWKRYFPYIQVFFYLGEGYSLGTLLLVVPLYVTRVFDVDTSTAGIATAFAGIPWLIKILYGLITDKYPIGKYGRRKPYLLIIAILSIPLWLFFATLTKFNGVYLGTLFFISLLAAFSDTTLDGYVVDITPDAKQQIMQSAAWGGRGVGTILASLISLTLVDQENYEMAYYLAGSIFVITTLSALALPVIDFENQSNLVVGFKKVFKLRETWLILIISTFMGAGQVMYTFASVLLDEYGFEDAQIRNITIFYFVGNVLGALLIGLSAKYIKLKSETLLALILLAGIVWSPLVVVSEAESFLFVFFFVLGMIMTAGTAVISKIAMEYSPVEVSSSMFALFASVNNLGLLIVSPLFTGFLLNFFSPIIVILLAAGWFVLGIIFLMILIRSKKRLDKTMITY